MGEDRTVADLKDSCAPIITNADLLPGVTTSVDGTLLDPAAPANPCGLVAKSYFTDSYRFFTQTPTAEDMLAKEGEGENELKINSVGIAWDSDKEYKFKNNADPADTKGSEAWRKVQW